MPTSVVAQFTEAVGVDLMVCPVRILARMSSIPTET